MSFQQIQKPKTATKKDKDNFSKNNSIKHDNNQSYHSSNNFIGFNFSDIGIFETNKVIQRKPISIDSGKYSRSRPVDNLTVYSKYSTKIKD